MYIMLKDRMVIVTKEHIQEWDTYTQMKKWTRGTFNSYKYYARAWVGREVNQHNVNDELAHRGNNYPSFLRNFLDCLNIKYSDKPHGEGITIMQQRGRKKSTEMVHHFTKDEMDKIIEELDGSKLGIMIRLMFEQGLRVSEVLNLQKKNFDMVNRVVKGIGKGNVRFHKQIYPKAYIDIEIYLRKFDMEDYPFRWKGLRHQRFKAWYEIKKVIGNILPYKNKEEIYPHVFRHTHGTMLRENGLDMREIQMSLRHKNLQTVEPYTAIDQHKLHNKLRGIFE